MAVAAEERVGVEVAQAAVVRVAGWAAVKEAGTAEGWEGAGREEVERVAGWAVARAVGMAEGWAVGLEEVKVEVTVAGRAEGRVAEKAGAREEAMVEVGTGWVAAWAAWVERGRLS